jgi:hypothetical protein
VVVGRGCHCDVVQSGHSGVYTIALNR